jgi:hypothetical protein
MHRVQPLLIAIASLLAAGIQPGAASEPAPRDAVLAQVIEAARERALNAPAVDWPAVEREADVFTAAQPGEAGRTAAIRHVLRALDDGHSHYIPPQPQIDAFAEAGTKPAPLAAPARDRPPIAVHASDRAFGRLVINAWVGGDDEAMAVATDVVRDALVQALAADDCGLIIDVASNTGGNMWPMMAGIAPLYDEGTLETFESRTDGRLVVNVRDGLLQYDDTVFPPVDGLAPLRAKPRYIAVLLGKPTASSGEITALGFKGQRNVRFFGQPTAGSTTANTSIDLTNGGTLALTTSRILDRTGAVQQGPVQPDVLTDDPVGEAEAWLESRCR